MRLQRSLKMNQQIRLRLHHQEQYHQYKFPQIKVLVLKGRLLQQKEEARDEVAIISEGIPHMKLTVLKNTIVIKHEVVNKNNSLFVEAQGGAGVVHYYTDEELEAIEVFEELALAFEVVRPQVRTQSRHHLLRILSLRLLNELVDQIDSAGPPRELLDLLIVLGDYCECLARLRPHRLEW